MTFLGWKAEALEFFEGLEADNSKAYWQAHRDEYDELVRAPMEELLAELEPGWGKGRIFRPYRDVRFSRDKSPYKTNIAATIGEGYVQLSAEGLGAGSGMWEMAPDQLVVLVPVSLPVRLGVVGLQPLEELERLRLPADERHRVAPAGGRARVERAVHVPDRWHVEREARARSGIETSDRGRPGGLIMRATPVVARASVGQCVGP